MLFRSVYFYVSGSRDESHPEDRNVAVFGGDVVISGSLKVEGCELTGSFSFDCDTLELTGSIEVEGTGLFTDGIATTSITLPNGDPFFASGAGISLTVAPSGQLSFSSNIVWNERLIGEANGSNNEFLLNNSPYSSETLMVFVNGVLQEVGSMNDFVLEGSKIVFITPPPVGSKVLATYSK